MASSFILSVVWLSLVCLKTTAFSPFSGAKHAKQSRTSIVSVSMANKNNPFNNNDDGDNDLFDNSNNNNKNDKLGIDIGKMLTPLSKEEAEELRAQASELISDKVAQGVDDIEALRAQLKQELQEQSQERLRKSEATAQEASAKLLSKIDSITDDFMSKTQDLRKSTKLAAAADQASQGKGVELGSWGSIGGTTVSTGGGGGLLGSVASSVVAQEATTSSMANDFGTSGDEQVATEVAPTENRILIIADPSQDPLAKVLIPAFEEEMRQAIADITIDVLKPTQTMPLGGNNAQCVICFTPSLNEGSSLRKLMDRLLRRTLQSDGIMASPPTQLVCVSTIGTERTNKMPYSMQNVLGGKLDKRRQVEEAVINTVQQRVTEPSLDYTIIKFGELKSHSNEDFALAPGDTLDGSTSVELAANALVQAVAFQPFARNATLSVVGNVPEGISDQVWDEAFVKLDGPELLRVTENLGDVSYFDQLNEYLGEWAILMESGKKKLATPIRVAPSRSQLSSREGVKERAGVRLLFLPTNTGSAYMSKAEERAREEQSSSSSKSNDAPRKRRTKPEGGVEVLVEVTNDNKLRVRARRCNMADDTVLKEISEEMILKRLQDSLDVWRKDIVSS